MVDTENIISPAMLMRCYAADISSARMLPLPLFSFAGASRCRHATMRYADCFAALLLRRATDADAMLLLRAPILMILLRYA